MDIVGKTFQFAYETETYLIEVVDETTVRWTQTRGPKTGKGDKERYVCSELSAHSCAISWIEADGLGLTNILDFKKMTVTTHANMGRDVFENTGELIDG